MQRSVLFLLLLVAGCLALTGFVLREDALRGRDGSKSALAVLFGDGRRLFANHFLAKADAYFHRGRYPSVFEMAERERGNHLVQTLSGEPDEQAHVHGPDCDHGGEETGPEGHVHGPDCDHAVEGGEQDGHEPDSGCAHAEPRQVVQDWIARLAARFEPDQHVHLEKGGEKEMLPWVKLAVEMDPHNVEAYAVGGYWLRQMGKPAEAQAFLREGQRNNPDSAEIYFELGRLYELQGEQSGVAARLYELSIEKWKKANEGLDEPDTLALGQVLGRLGKVREAQGEWTEALRCYQLLQKVSPNPDAIQHLIDSVQEQLARPTLAPQPSGAAKSG